MSEVKGFKMVYCDRPARIEIHDMNGGMCSYCYEGNGGAETTAFKFMQAAQSELAALREELAERNKHPDWVQVEIHKNGIEERDADIETLAEHNIELQQRLTAAEQRNALISKLLQRCIPVCRYKGSHTERALINEIEAALKPTESGASE